jgi:hypothetical protein
MISLLEPMMHVTDSLRPAQRAIFHSTIGLPGLAEHHPLILDATRSLLRSTMEQPSRASQHLRQ